MPSYTINYEAWNEYQNHVGESFFSMLLLPCDDAYQQLIRYKIENSLQENVFLTKNHHGFSQLMIHSLKPFNELSLKMHCDVRVTKFNPYGYTPAPPEEEEEILRSIDFKIDHFAFLQISQYTDVHRGQLGAEWMKKKEESVDSFLHRLNKKIHDEFEYDPENTSIHQNAFMTMEEKSGVCQDYVHVFIGVAITNHIPCRYVSGYLNQGSGFVGAMQMHAWVEAFIPGAGWIGFDPTNNLVRDSNYVKVCHGADYEECSPIKGVLKTVGENQTRYEVKVIQQ